MQRVYGPYLHKKLQRRIVVIIFSDGRRTTKSYARYLMEKQLGRELSNNEEVDHIDGNKLNDGISNLQILTKSENIRKGRVLEMISFYCLRCGQVCSKPAAKIRANRKQGKLGPFCGRSCAASYCLSGGYPL